MNDYEKYCPFCDICGDRITDEEYLTDGKHFYHHPRYKDCLETEQTDTYVENERIRYAYIRES